MIHLINIVHASTGVIDNAPNISQLLLRVFNFFLEVFGIVAIISIIISAFVYLTSAGDEDRIKQAKKMLLYSIVGIVAVLGSMIIIKTISAML